MRAKLFIVLESVFLGLGLLILTPSANPTALGKAGSPSQTASAPQNLKLNHLLQKPSRNRWLPGNARPAGTVTILTASRRQTAKPMICTPRRQPTRRCPWDPLSGS